MNRAPRGQHSRPARCHPQRGGAGRGRSADMRLHRRCGRGRARAPPRTFDRGPVARQPVAQASDRQRPARRRTREPDPTRGSPRPPAAPLLRPGPPRPKVPCRGRARLPPSARRAIAHRQRGHRPRAPGQHTPVTHRAFLRERTNTAPPRPSCGPAVVALPGRLRFRSPERCGRATSRTGRVFPSIARSGMRRKLGPWHLPNRRRVQPRPQGGAHPPTAGL